MPRLPLTTLACIALALGGAFAAGCGSDDKKDSNSSAQAPAPPAPDTSAPKTTSKGDASTSASKPVAVAMQSSKFAPDAISAKVGQKITWTNKDGYAHNVTSTAGEKIESGNIDGGATYEFTPKQAGTIAYTCTLHTDQNGKITVTK